MNAVLANTAKMCMRCIHKTQEMLEVLGSQLSFKDKAEVILDIAANCPSRNPWQEHPDGRDFADGNSHERVSCNRNPYEKDADLADDRTSDDFWHMGECAKCKGFETEPWIKAQIRLEKAYTRNERAYWKLDTAIRVGIAGFSSVTRFVKNLAMIQYPDHSRACYDNFRGGRMFYKWNDSGFEFHNSNGKFIRHRKCMAELVALMLECSSQSEREKSLLFLMCAPKDSIAGDVWWWLLKSDVKIAEASITAVKFADNLGKETDKLWHDRHDIGNPPRTEAYVPIAAKHELGDVEDFDIDTSHLSLRISE